MNKFLYDKLPICHARIYRAFLQKNGRSIISNTIKMLESGENKEQILNELGANVSNDISIAINDLSYLNNNNYLDKVSNTYKTNHVDNFTSNITGILLQVIANQRWSKKYDTGTGQFDMILAIPKWSRVVSLSTSEISSQYASEISSQYESKKIEQFDILTLDNFKMQYPFNKLHGLRGRKILLGHTSNTEKIITLRKLNFISRTIQDLQLLMNSTKLQTFTLIPDTTFRLRLGLCFLTVCKITDIVTNKKNSGLDLNNYILTVSDPTGHMKCRLSIDNNSSGLWHKLKSGWLQTELNRYLNINTNENIKFDSPTKLNNNMYFMIFGNWYLGDDYANISTIIPIQTNSIPDLPHIIEYMNTRKKIKFNDYNNLFKNNLSLLNYNLKNMLKQNIIVDKNSETVYYKEDDWDSEIFLELLDHDFKKPSLSIRSKYGIREFNDMYKIINEYLIINQNYKKVYQSKDFEQSIEKIYDIQKFDTVKYDENDEDDILFQIDDWRKYNEPLSSLLIKLNHTTDELFNWSNGNKMLYNKWVNHENKNKSITHDLRTHNIKSALYFIFQARGTVYIPEIIYNKLM